MDQLGIKLNVSCSKSDPRRPIGKQRFEFKIGRETARASTNQRKVPNGSVQISLVNTCLVFVSSFSKIQVFSFFPMSVELGKSESIHEKRSHLSLNGNRPSTFIERNVKVGVAKHPYQNSLKMKFLVSVKQK
ncbi:hypothetical protein Patl1_26240 [Pistacia atlantica]|uniref:Uncharacterized protein n=1 Tax=Pistacia atlantica TaxID=434234 RepID=A0ACC1B4E2_9ROSI|nr:hypothetical protein Patl1_26240 [Pistacia atlantica]